MGNKLLDGMIKCGDKMISRREAFQAGLSLYIGVGMVTCGVALYILFIK